PCGGSSIPMSGGRAITGSPPSAPTVTSSPVTGPPPPRDTGTPPALPPASPSGATSKLTPPNWQEPRPVTEAPEPGPAGQAPGPGRVRQAPGPGPVTQAPRAARKAGASYEGPDPSARTKTLSGRHARHTAHG